MNYRRKEIKALIASSNTYLVFIYLVFSVVQDKAAKALMLIEAVPDEATRPPIMAEAANTGSGCTRLKKKNFHICT